MIFHLVEPLYWQTFDKQGIYFSETFSDEKFIHCCTTEQLSGVLRRFYKGVGSVLKLEINDEKLINKPTYEATADGEKFPHIYGGINKDAITKIEVLTEVSEGKYKLDKELYY
jgi:uncharacterized protein (DUF952 family)